MITLNWSSSFKRAYRKLIKKNPSLKDKTLAVINQLQQDPLHASLKAHKLKGILEGVWACSIDYNIRIVFDFVENPETHITEILLIDIGTHEEVY